MEQKQRVWQNKRVTTLYATLPNKMDKYMKEQCRILPILNIDIFVSAEYIN